MDEITVNRQQGLILEALAQPSGTTAGELKDRFGIMDGRKRISELRAKGFLIEDHYETGINKLGLPCRYKRYRLEGSMCPTE